MNIVFVITTMRRGGAERVVASLANIYAENGDSVMVVVFDGGESEYALDSRVNYIRYDFGNAGKLGRLIGRFRFIKEKISGFSPDAVLCFAPHKLLGFLLLAFPKRRFRIIGSERSDPYYEKRSRLVKISNRFFSVRSDGFVFLNEGIKSYYPQSLQNKSTIIPNGVFADGIPEKPVPFEKRDLKKICAVGRLWKVKGYDTMLRAFAVFHKEHPDCTLTICGIGPDLEELKALCAELGIDGSVVFAGLVEDVPGFISDAGMFLFTSESESWGNALLEAMACGLPCVSTDCNFGPREMITDSLNGLLVPVGDFKAIAAAMAKIADDPAFAEKLSENALKVKETFDARTIAERYRCFLRDGTK